MCREMKPQGHRGGKAPIEPMASADSHVPPIVRVAEPVTSWNARLAPPFLQLLHGLELVMGLGLGLTTPPNSGHFIESS